MTSPALFCEGRRRGHGRRPGERLRAGAGPGSAAPALGILAPSTAANEAVTLKPFFDEMRQLGWIEGQNIDYDWAVADDQQQMLPQLANEMVARKPQLVYAPPLSAALAAQQATRSIPIIFASVADPVGSGLVASLAHPGGNVTGIAGVFASLALIWARMPSGIIAPAVGRLVRKALAVH